MSAHPGSDRTRAGEDPTVAELGEDALVAAVLDCYRAAGVARGPELAVGPGDDAAVVELPGPLVVSTDALVEGRDFRRDWSSGADVGVKVAAQNLADVAAMGAVPRVLVVSLCVPRDLGGRWVLDLARGIAAEARRASVLVAGGDLSEAEEIVVTGTALGSLPGRRAVRRAGAAVGDRVGLSGKSGDSAAGLAVLQARDEEVTRQFEALVQAHRRPQPVYEAGVEASLAGATAMIDVSDGLLRDAGRIAQLSGVGIDLDPSALGATQELRAAAALLGVDPMEWVLAGGEDHALLACFPPGVAMPRGFREVGQVVAREPGEEAVSVGGSPWRGSPGWTHFS